MDATRTRRTLHPPAVLLAGLLLAAVECEGTFSTDDDPSPPAEPAMKGATITSWWHDDYLQSHVPQTVGMLSGACADTVGVLTTWYHVGSGQITTVGDKTPVDDGIVAVLDEAKALGMRTVLKPHVDPDDGSWRGYIDFGTDESAWATWWTNYRTFILKYAQLAEIHDVDVLVIGTELEGTVHRTEWLGIIDDIRLVYGGKLVYAANWDSYPDVPFWNELDYIGIDAYFPLTDSDSPPVADLVAAWDTHADAIVSYARQQNLPVIITEVGYQSYDGCNRTPWNAPSQTEDDQEQADCLDAALAALLSREEIAGVWLWMTYHRPLDDIDGFDFFYKPAALVVEERFTRP